MRLLLAANNQATRRNEIIKNYLQLGSSSNRYAPRLPQQETKSSTKQLPPTGPILGPENILKTGFAQKGLPSTKYGPTPDREAFNHKTLRLQIQPARYPQMRPQHHIQPLTNHQDTPKSHMSDIAARQQQNLPQQPTNACNRNCTRRCTGTK